MNIYIKRKLLISLPLAGALSFILTYGIALPTLIRYPRIRHVMERFAYTDEIFCVGLAFLMWLFYLQWLFRKLNVIFCYWSASLYLLLLFIVLFTKAPKYHSLELNPLAFLELNKSIVTENSLNFLFFIPLGLIYGLFAKKFWELLVIALGKILTIETLQYVFYLGVFDLRDIVFNLLGCLVGYLIFPKLKAHFVSIS